MPPDSAGGGAYGWTTDLAREIRHSARTLRRSPRFALVVILTLGLGVGAATAIFSVVDTILLRPLPFRDAERLVAIVQHMPPHRPDGQRWSRGFTRQQFEQWRTGTRTLSTLAATTSSIGFVRTSEGTARLWGGMVSGSTFPLLGSRALLGRTLVETDLSAPNVVVLSFDVWRRLFRSDPDIVGKPAEFLDIERRLKPTLPRGSSPWTSTAGHAS